MKGSDLKTIRKTARLSQTGFGRLIGVHRTTVSDWERGDAGVPVAVGLIARLIAERPELLPSLERWRGMR